MTDNEVDAGEAVSVNGQSLCLCIFSTTADRKTVFDGGISSVASGSTRRIPGGVNLLDRWMHVTSTSFDIE